MTAFSTGLLWLSSATRPLMAVDSPRLSLVLRATRCRTWVALESASGQYSIVPLMFPRSMVADVSLVMVPVTVTVHVLGAGEPEDWDV